MSKRPASVAGRSAVDGGREGVATLSAHATIETAVKATQAGARDFLEKPLSTEKVLVVLSNAFRLTDVWTRADGTWRVMARHSSILA